MTRHLCCTALFSVDAEIILVHDMNNIQQFELQSNYHSLLTALFFLTANMVELQ